MPMKNYRHMLYEAKQDLAHHLVKRQKLDQEIARRQAVVAELQNLCAEQDKRSFEQSIERVIKADLKVGITDAVRVILQENFFPMTTIELKEKIAARKFNLTRYANPLAVIHTILKRLIQSGDVRVAPAINSMKAYQWISPTEKALSELQKTSQATAGKSGAAKESK